ncbi:uncharacterized protein TRIADDRAFT_25871 [Trichoplax adhaerens]|uniref:N-alpha-acetyltransferase 15, NatA auxiliary subunit n=1 Tax=Trichoplax adhaerens TaxID=10228 RepID=B3RYH3_TRIAD|nr:hypothetical protein TRIADDRAFT_25871 [Trichoplax adhaerens]EDV25040.1 hypothetical protein TRIADDRAFT_25871 [Trichoplax adhaerens]|eukprot:XP_002112930.1 hypothetical protein TRIADDRAFT_25871 [Trichoplax adhaerens]
MPSQLPPKENNLFKRVVKCYEQKQYKNGLKFAKQILSTPKYADHGETLAMKGLILNCLGKKEEAFDLVRRGLRNDLKSQVCWHVFGLLQRSEKKYDEAIKCYRNALKWDKDNLQILRDLSLLQIQMRDLEGYRDTRYQLLKLRPGQRASWIGYSMACHLLEDFDTALAVLEEYRKTQEVKSYDYEFSEFLLYQNSVYREAGRNKDCLEHLEKYEKQICDQVSIMEVKAIVSYNLGLKDKAEKYYRQLIDRNPSNNDYYTGLVKVLELSTDEMMANLYSEFVEKYKYSHAPKLLRLQVTSGDTFKRYVGDYIKHALRRGSPPLFLNIRPLLKDKTKAKIIEELVLDYSHNLKNHSKLLTDDENKEPPTTYLWTLFFLAQYYDHFRKLDVAMKYVEEVLDHTPTLIEGYTLQAKIYKHADNLQLAAKLMDEARSLDTADRYINSKSAKYQLKIDNIEKAEETCAMFTREGVSAIENLNEMQCMWFQTECAASFLRQGKIGEALKKCHEIDKHFTDIIEDQFDFHTYCMRKMTLKAYISMLRMEDILRSHPFYFKCAVLAIQAYVSLHDNPITETEEDTEVNSDGLTAKELKKLKSKQRRAKKKAELKEEKKADSKDTNDKKKADDNAEPKLDPKKLVQIPDPLDQAIKFLRPLQDWSAETIDTHLYAFDIYYRKGKYLLMLQSLKRARNIDSQNPQLHINIVKFALAVKAKADLNKAVSQVVETELEVLLEGMKLQEFNDNFIERNKNSIAHQSAGAEALNILNPSASDRVLQLCCNLSYDHIETELPVCAKVYKNLQKDTFGKVPESVIETYRKSCSQLFPLAAVFQDNQTASETNEVVSSLSELSVK